MNIYVLLQEFNRDDDGDIATSCNFTRILGVYASKKAAKEAALLAKRKFFKKFSFHEDKSDREEYDIVYQQSIDDDTLEVYAEDYPYKNNWGEFYVSWDIHTFRLKGDAPKRATRSVMLFIQ